MLSDLWNLPSKVSFHGDNLIGKTPASSAQATGIFPVRPAQVNPIQ